MKIDILTIESNENCIRVYNDNTGESISISKKFLDRLFSMRNKTTKMYLLSFVRLFWWNPQLNELIFNDIDLENEYHTIKRRFHNIFTIETHKQLDEFTWSLSMTDKYN